MVVGKFYPPHAGHHALIRAAAARCAEVTVVVAPSRRESIPLPLRLGWLREVHADTPWVRFVGRYDDHPVDYADPAVWDAHCAVFREAVGSGSVDAVFSSEAYGAELARRFHAVPVAVDPDRRTVPVSGTAVRADPAGHWRWLSPPVREWFVRRVVVVGAESTGTTTMAAALAAHYGTSWVPEYGRELTARKLARLRERTPEATVFDVAWDRDDFRAVVREQQAAEDAADLVEFVHQLPLVLQSPGGVDDQHVDAGGGRLLHGFIDDAGRIAAFLSGNDGHTQPFRPDLELADGGGAERVARR